MRKEDWTKFYPAFKQVSRAFAMRKEDLEAKAEAYFYFLQRYDLSIVLNALIRCVEKIKYFPSISEIIGEIERNGMSEDEIALLAWEKTWNGLKKVSGNRTVIFDDPFIHQTLDIMGGWAKFSLAKAKDEPKLRKDFILWYKHFAKKNNLSEVPAMTGWDEIEVEKWNGRIAIPPVVIGDKEKAKRVYALVYGEEALRKILEGGKDDTKAIAK